MVINILFVGIFVWSIGPR